MDDAVNVQPTQNGEGNLRMRKGMIRHLNDLNSMMHAYGRTVGACVCTWVGFFDKPISLIN